jgi:hypothetical protein
LQTALIRSGRFFLWAQLREVVEAQQDETPLRVIEIDPVGGFR